MNEKFCISENCPNPARTKGMCATHYHQALRGYEPRTDFNGDQNPPCAVSHCELPASTSAEGSFCNSHYQWSYRGVDPETRLIDRNGRSEKTCWVDGCSKRAETKSLCNYHARAARTGSLEVPAELGVKLNDPCAFEGCDRPYKAKKLCHTHYTQLNAGKALTEIQDWGKYVKGEHICGLPNCRRVAISSGLCVNHKSLQMKYGLTTDRMIEIWTDPVCENPWCGATKRLHMDHDHETGEFRGLLCGNCNTALGHLKESIDRMEGLIVYKRRFSV